MDKVETALKAFGKFVAGLIEPAASLISRYPKGTMIVWAISLAITARFL